MDAIERRAQRQRIEEEAARLVVERSPHGDPVSDPELLRWAAQSPTHGVALSRAQAAWASAERMRGLPLAWAPPERTTGYRPSRRAVAAGVAAAIIGGTSAVLLRGSGGDRFTTAVGERRHVALADGSYLHLNTDTVVDVVLDDHFRNVALLRGEAMFDIFHDATRPFIVTAGSTVLKVLGTAFNVQLRHDLVELVVTRGLVGVENGASGLRKVPGGSSAAISDGLVAVTSLPQAALARRVAWQEGLIDFDGQTLGEAVAEFNRYLPHPIIVADPTLDSMRLGGTFAMNDSDKFIDALEASFAIKAVRTPGQSIMLVRSSGIHLR